MLTAKEQEYLKSNQLAHLGTVGSDNQADVVPVRVEFDGQHFYVGGDNVTHSRKYKNVAAGNIHVALVVDDFVPAEGGPPGIRGIRVYGTAELTTHEGWRGSAPHLKITPTSWSWGIEAPAFGEKGFVTHKTQWRDLP